MQTPVITHTSLRTLGIILTCGALAVGCAGNSVKPLQQETGAMTEAKQDSPPAVASEEENITSTPAPTDHDSQLEVANAEQSGSVTVSDTSSTTSDTTTVDSADTSGNTDNSSIQQPQQMTFYFGLNKTGLSEQDKTVLKEHAQFLKANPTLILEINGHTDHTGPHQYNEYLSKQRADAVAKVLISEGVTRSQLVINALADDTPLVEKSDPGKNRRVELQYDEMNMVGTM